MNRDADTFISNLSQAARDNPLATALIGGGALWLLFGNRPITGAISGAATIAQPLAEGSVRGVAGAAGAIANAGGRATEAMMETARSATDTVREAASDGAATIKDRLSDAFDRATDGASRTAEAIGRGTSETVRSTPNPMPHLQEGYAKAQSALTDLLERQPLVLGAIGLAIGAGVASAVASTAFENEWAGSLSDDVKEAVQGHAEHVAETAQRAAGEVGSDFRAAASEAADKLRKAGEDAVQTVRDKVHAGQD